MPNDNVETILETSEPCVTTVYRFVRYPELYSIQNPYYATKPSKWTGGGNYAFSYTYGSYYRVKFESSCTTGQNITFKLNVSKYNDDKYEYEAIDSEEFTVTVGESY